MPGFRAIESPTAVELSIVFGVRTSSSSLSHLSDNLGVRSQLHTIYVLAHVRSEGEDLCVQNIDFQMAGGEAGVGAFCRLRTGSCAANHTFSCLLPCPQFPQGFRIVGLL